MLVGCHLEPQHQPDLICPAATRVFKVEARASLTMEVTTHTWFYLQQQGKCWVNGSWHKLAPPWLKQAKFLCNNSDLFLLDLSLWSWKLCWVQDWEPFGLCLMEMHSPAHGWLWGQVPALPRWFGCWVAVNPAVVLTVVLGLFHMCSANLSR